MAILDGSEERVVQRDSEAKVGVPHPEELMWRPRLSMYFFGFPKALVFIKLESMFSGVN